MTLAAWKIWRGTLWNSPKLLKVLLWSIPLPLIACQLGWIAAEVGRQPWIVYKLLRTSEAASITVSAGEILFSIILFGVDLPLARIAVCVPAREESETWTRAAGRKGGRRIMDLNMVWFLLVGVLIIGYAILDGFDLGVGVLHLFARSEEERRVHINRKMRLPVGDKKSE